MVLVSVQILLLGACTLGREQGQSPPAGSGASRSAEDHQASASPESPRPGRSLSAEPIHPEEAQVVTGTLGFDAVEAGCGYLQTADGKRYEVIYPDGWRLDRGTGHLLGPDGQTVGPGAVVTVRGSIASDIASFCQVGPIFRASEVLSAGY